MKLIVICVVYPPKITSAAIQINHLVEQLSKDGHIIEVITPDSSLKKAFSIENKKNIKIIRFKNGRIIDTGLVNRTLNEFFMPFKIIYTIIKNKIKLNKCEGIIYWSPSIFLTPLIIYLKIINKCKSYLILRDIFPRWARDLKIIKNRFVYQFFNFFFLSHCYFSDVIGIQSKGNKNFLPKSIFLKKLNIEVLNNWYSLDYKNKNCSVNLSKTNFKNKKIFIHAGNIGLAQGFEILIKIAQKLQDNKDIGFLFIGRGTQFERMKSIAKEKSISNIMFHNQIDNSQILNLYNQCHFGIVILDKRHKTHNIPGKFIAYLHSGLPIFAIVNSNNDIINFIRNHKLGYVTYDFCEDDIVKKIIEFTNSNTLDPNINKICKITAKKFFNTKKASDQILRHF